MGCLRFGSRPCRHPVDRQVAPVAKQKGLPFFHSENRDEKQAEPMIHPLHPGPGQAADGTKTRGCVEDGCFRLNPRDENHVAILNFRGLQMTSRIRKSNRVDWLAGLMTRAVSAPLEEPPIVMMS